MTPMEIERQAQRLEDDGFAIAFLLGSTVRMISNRRMTTDGMAIVDTGMYLVAVTGEVWKVESE
jgi:hypothetical protein